MATITAKLKGGRRLRRTLKRYPGRVKKGLQLQLVASTQKVRDGAKQRAPVLTTNLQGSIREDFQRLDELYAEVKTVVEYARRQELGFTGTDSLGRSYDQPGKFFMTNAAKAEKKDFVRGIKQSIEDAAP